jgi:hypothetical protein
MEGYEGNTTRENDVPIFKMKAWKKITPKTKINDIFRTSCCPMMRAKRIPGPIHFVPAPCVSAGTLMHPCVWFREKCLLACFSSQNKWEKPNNVILNFRVYGSDEHTSCTLHRRRCCNSYFTMFPPFLDT